MLGKKPEIHLNLWSYFPDVQANWCTQAAEWIADVVISCAALVESSKMFTLELNANGRRRTDCLQSEHVKGKSSSHLPQINPSLSCLIFPVCEMDTIARQDLALPWETGMSETFGKDFEDRLLVFITVCNTSHHETLYALYENKGIILPCPKVMLSFHHKILLLCWV